MLVVEHRFSLCDRPLEEALPGHGELEVLQVIQKWASLQERYAAFSAALRSPWVAVCKLKAGG